MEQFIIHYKDKIGRKNQTEVSGQTEFDAKEKFEILYAECVITNIETKK